MTTADDLYRLLPAVHRLRDSPLGGPLRDLLEVLASQADVVDADLGALADAWFIETAPDWLVPYLGDLLGATPLHAIGTAAAEPRAYVARTVEYRQAKGTVAVLEQLCRDVTGWPTRAVELFALLAWTQNVNHVRPDRSATPDMHDPEVGALADGPFDCAPRTVDVRRLATRGGRYNLPNVGLFVYRLQPLTTEGSWAARGGAAGRWHLDPLARDVQLFNPGRVEAGIGDLAVEADLPGPLRRRPLADELEALRDPRVSGHEMVWFSGRRPAVALESRSAAGLDWEPVPPAEIVICDLADWRPPPQARTYPGGAGGEVTRPVRAALDPHRGRVTFRSDDDPVELRTVHTTALPMPMGGGAYDRDALEDGGGATVVRHPDRRLLVGRDLPVGDGLFTDLATAVNAWRGDPAGHSEIVITDNGIYEDALQGGNRLELLPGTSLRIVAGRTALPAAGAAPDPLAPLHRVGVRPVLTGRISVRGDGGDPDGVGHLELDGLWLAGGLSVLVGNLATLRLVDVTLVPGSDLEVRTGAAGSNAALRVEVTRAITGPLQLGDAARSLELHTAIVDASGVAIGAERADVTIVDSTVLGSVAAQTLRADNVVFTGDVTVRRRQTGCLRYCVLPTRPPTRTPRRYRCQPDLALTVATGGGELDPQTEAAIRARMRPVFTSDRHGHPAYCQLAPRTADEITAGAEDGSEMGVYRALQQPARRSNLDTALPEYLRAGLEAGAIYVT